MQKRLLKLWELTSSKRIGGKRMIKRRKRLIAAVACVCMIGQMCTGVSAEELENSKVSAKENIVDTGTQEQKIELNSSLESYFEDDQVVEQIENLEITSMEGYLLTEADLQYLSAHFLNLKKLDVTQCGFDSKETYNAFQSYFEKHTDIKYFYTKIAENEENEIKSNDVENEKNEKTPQADSIYNSKEEDETSVEAQKQGKFSIKVNGLCLLDKGSYTEVGAAYTSDDPNVEFRWLQYDLSKKVWTVVSDWNKGNWITWKPKKAGDYWIYVEAKTTDGNTDTSVYGYHYAGIKVELNGICLLDRGTHFDVGVAYNSNDPELKFRWKVYDLQKKTWSLLQKETTGNWTSWYPEDKGSYWLLVEVIDSNGEVHTSVTAAYYEGIKLALNGICTIENTDHVDAGVAYNTNDANVQFQWKLYDLAEKKWSDITGWTTGNWMSWYPEKAGDYWLYVQARTRTGKIESQVMGYRVGEAEITNFTVNPESPAWTDSTIKLQGNYRDLIRSVASSRFLVYDGHNWSEIAKDVQSADWTPGIIGSYLLCYELDDSNGNAITQTFRGYSIENPYININNINVNQAGSMRYNLSVSSETNDKNAQYKWMYYDIATGQWHDISGWSNSKSITWNAPKEGAFWLHVKAKIHDGTIKDYTIGYTVQKYAADLNAMLAYANLYSSSTPYILMVNRSTHKVGIFQGWKGNWTPINYWDCGDGAPSTPTVTGVFTVKSRGYYFDSGNARCYWYTQFYGNYLFHSVLYSKYNGSLLDGRVGMALSHGCVRLKIENAKWIYDNIPSGSTVVVY
mgnify:FL=1